MYGLAKAILFRLDAEAAHELVTRQMARSQNIHGLLSVLSRALRVPPKPVRVWGLTFANPLGIAAGFDKNAELMPFLRALGFGFIEVGTITLRPQPGNPRPRMFRYPRQGALINRLGFNNDGAEAAADRLAADWADPDMRALRQTKPLFANIGKNKEVPIDAATENYLDCYRIVAPLVDGVVVNVSSPNTAALRDLQRPEHLEGLLAAIRNERDSTRFVREEGAHPIILKIAPDLEDAQLQEIAELGVRLADGITATNTTVERRSLGDGSWETGGLSGRPLLDDSTRILNRLRALVGHGFPLIGVGGIMSAEDARAKLDAGATLVQAYTGFVYGGPGFARNVVAGLEETR